jgi:hypothetical protein
MGNSKVINTKPCLHSFARYLAWYKSHCDGDWEHSFGIDIKSMDNPGFWITIDLAETECSEMSLEVTDNGFEQQYSDSPPSIWYKYWIEESKFICYCSTDAFEVVFDDFMKLVDGERARIGIPTFEATQFQNYAAWLK